MENDLYSKNDGFVVLNDCEIHLVDPSTLTDAASPLSAQSSTHYEAVKTSIGKVGQLHPIMVTSNGAVHDGRLVRRACAELGIKVAIKYITDEGAKTCWLASLHHREWTIPDKAKFVAYIILHQLYASEPALPGDTHFHDRVARYIKNEFGWKRDVNNGRSIRKFLKLFHAMRHLPLDMHSYLATAGTIHAALRFFAGCASKNVRPTSNAMKRGEKWVTIIEQQPHLDDDELGKMKALLERIKTVVTNNERIRLPSQMLVENQQNRI